MKTEPITKSRPSIQDLANGINKLHYCFEESQSVARSDRRAIMDEISSLRRHLGAEEGAAKPVGLLSQRSALLKSAGVYGGTLSGLFFLWKFLVYLWPFLVNFAMK